MGFYPTNTLSSWASCLWECFYVFGGDETTAAAPEREGGRGVCFFGLCFESTLVGGVFDGDVELGKRDEFGSAVLFNPFKTRLENHAMITMLRPHDTPIPSRINNNLCQGAIGLRRKPSIKYNKMEAKTELNVINSQILTAQRTMRYV